jgi:hypothetical protein
MSQNKLFYFRPVARRKVIHLMIAGREKERERGEERKREREKPMISSALQRHTPTTYFLQQDPTFY